MAIFLANENVPGDAAEAARQAGIDLAWIKESAVGADDDSVLAMSVDARFYLLFSPFVQGSKKN